MPPLQFLRLNKTMIIFCFVCDIISNAENISRLKNTASILTYSFGKYSNGGCFGFKPNLLFTLLGAIPFQTVIFICFNYKRTYQIRIKRYFYIHNSYRIYPQGLLRKCNMPTYKKILTWGMDKILYLLICKGYITSNHLPQS